VTLLTYDNFLTYGFGLCGVFLVIQVVLMLSRTGKGIADYEIIGFRASTAFVSWAIALRDIIEPSRELIVIAVIMQIITLLATTIRICRILYEERHGH
jgi:hypothetical protein